MATSTSRHQLAPIIGTMLEMTGQRQREKRPRDSEESVRRLIDAIPQIVWMNNIEGAATYFNRRWYDYTGLDYGQSVERGWQAVIHPDDAVVSNQRWEHALHSGEVFECEYRLRNAKGEYRWFIGRNVPLRENDRIIEWLGSATDIHDLKQTESAWRQSDERYRLMVDGARDYAIFMMNPSNPIVYWSAGAERVFGWTAAEAVGQSGELIFTPEDRKNEQEEKEIEVALREGCANDQRWHI